MTDSLAPRPFGEPHPTRLAADDPRRGEILAVHADAMARGRTHYDDPATGFLVFTAAFLAARTKCCNSFCRHCPYLV